MWALLGLFSALFLGIYDIFKKLSLNGNAVLPVLFFATCTSAVIFLPVAVGSVFFPEFFRSIGLFAPSLNYSEHLLILLKAAIVVSSWILAFFAMKHLPITIFSPIRSTGPLWTMIGALIIFHEKLNLQQWIGVTITLGFFFLFSTTGKGDGIKFHQNKWILFLILGTLLGGASGLYDKFIIRHIDRIAMQAWFSFYQVVLLFPVLMIFWFPKRKKTTPFKWRWSIPAIGLTLVVADFLYFYALSYEGSMISMISALRRGSVIITFTLGALIFKEQNLKSKAVFLSGIIIGILMITLGSR
jgi:bacterial/archaeal transporter family protein